MKKAMGLINKEKLMEYLQKTLNPLQEKDVERIIQSMHIDEQLGVLDDVMLTLIQSTSSKPIIGSAQNRNILKVEKNNDLYTDKLSDVTSTEEWGFLDKLSVLTLGKINELRNTLFEQSKDLDINPVDTSKVLQGLDKANDIIRTTNPFGLLITSIKNYRNTENEVMKSSMLRETFKSAGASLGQAKDAFVATNSVLKGLGIASDEVSQQMMGDITNMIGSASQLATGFATSNPVAIIQGSLGLFTSALSLFDGKTRKANKKIKENAVELKKLEESYKSLEEAMKSALGGDHFKHQVDQVKNLATQQEKIQNQFDAENSKSKKKKDNKKLEEYQKAKKDLEYQADDLKRNLLKDLLTTDVGSFAKTIADDIMKGFEKGFANASGVVDKSVDDLMKKIIAHQFEVLVVQKAMIPFQNKAEKAAEDGSFTDQEIKDLSNTAKGAKDEIAEGWKAYETLLKDMKLEPDGSTPKDSTQTTSGQLQASMTEGTASALVGLWNSSSLDIRRLKEIAETQRTEPVPVEIYNPESNELQTLQGLTDEQLQQARSGADSVRELLSQSMLIEQNTRRTADNTGTIITELQSGFGKLEGQLTSIERNTKGSKSRA